MSREYNPDKWVLIQIGEDQKVLGGWSGGYLDSDNWRLSSGVVDVVEDGDYYLFHNHSGSIYKCHKKAGGLTSLSGSIYNKMVQAGKNEGITVEIVDMEKEDED